MDDRTPAIGVMLNLLPGEIRVRVLRFSYSSKCRRA